MDFLSAPFPALVWLELREYLCTRVRDQHGVLGLGGARSVQRNHRPTIVQKTDPP